MVTDGAPFIQLLTDFAVRGVAASRPLPMPAARLVAFTALNGPVGREALAAALWPDSSRSRALSYLRAALWRLNAAAPGLVTAADRAISLAPNVQVDAAALLRWTLRCLHDPAGAGPVPDRHDLGRELLPAWDDPWLDQHREQLQVLVPEALEAAAGEQLQRGALPDALWHALRASHIDPLRETAVRLRICIELQQGNRHVALRTFDQYRQRLLRELGVEPTARLTALVTGLDARSTGRERRAGRAARDAASSRAANSLRAVP